MESPAQVRHLRELAVARAERARAELETALREIELYDQLLALHRDVNTSTPSEQMQTEKRNIAISAGVDGKDAFLRAIRAKGYTLRSLAEAIGCPASLLSMQRKGERPIPYKRAKEIERRTGWPAAKDHWPGGLS